MSVKKILYIDDSKIDSQIENLRKKLARVGIELHETFLHINDKFRVKDSTTGSIKLDKGLIQNYIIEHYSRESFDLVASDYDFKDTSLDGFVLLKWIKNESNSKKFRLRRAKFCLYSAEQDKVARQFSTPEQVKKLIKLRIDDFVDRGRIPDEFTQILLANDKEFLFRKHIIDYLEKHGSLTFKSTYPKFKGKTLKEIANEIDQSSPNGIEFQKTIFDLALAHMIDLNED